MRLVGILLLAAIGSGADGDSSTVQLRTDDDAKKLTVVVDGREIVSYQYGERYAPPLSSCHCLLIAGR